MGLINQISNSEVIESTNENQEAIKEAIDIIFSYWSRDPLVYIAVNEISQKAYICLYAEPLEKMWEEPIALKRDENHDWVPAQSIIDIQLSRLNHDSQDSL